MTGSSGKRATDRHATRARRRAVVVGPQTRETLRALEYRTLGSTGIRVSALGLGAASLGGVYGEVDEGEAIATVHRAFDLGVTLFDASPYYGNLRAETVLGKALRGLPRDDYVLSTKAGRYGVDDFDFTPARLTASLDESLARLQVERVDLFWLHDVEFGDLDQIFGESLPAILALKQGGKIGSAGVTGLPLSMLRRALERPIDAALSYCHATLFDTRLLRLVPDFEARGIGLLNASATAMGLLANHGPCDWHPAGPEIRTACLQAAKLCRERGVELAELALSYTASLPGPAATLCGTASPTAIAANVRAVSTPPDPELLTAVQRVLAPVHSQTWPQGRPENQ